MPKINYLSKSFGVPLQKAYNQNERGQLLVRGFFTSDNKDEVGDIITRDATEKAIPSYKTWGNIRYMHQPRPVAVVERIGSGDGLAWNEVEIRVVDEDAAFQVREGLLRALSVGILIKDLDDVSFTDDGGLVIHSYSLAEISLVDHPANYDAKLNLEEKAVPWKAMASPVEGYTLSKALQTKEEDVMPKEEVKVIEQEAEVVETAVEETETVVEKAVEETFEEEVSEEVSEEIVEDVVEKDIVEDVVEESVEEIDQIEDETIEESEVIEEEVSEESDVERKFSLDDESIQRLSKAIIEGLSEVIKSLSKDLAVEQGQTEDTEDELETEEVSESLETTKSLETRIEETLEEVTTKRASIPVEVVPSEETEEELPTDLIERAKARISASNSGVIIQPRK